MTQDTLVVDVAEVQRVVGLDAHPAVRNLLITARYHDLSEGMRLRTGGSLVNWCTFGTWASKTAGGFIREDEVPKAFQNLLVTGNVSERIADALDLGDLLDIAGRIVGDASTFVMTGNLVVFAELAEVFAGLLTTVSGDTAPDFAKLAQFQATLSDGMPQPDEATWNADRTALVVVRRGGQSLLKDMAASYYAAMFEADPKKRAELVLLANARGGIHEQTRLQSYIRAALDAPIADTLLAHAHARVERAVVSEPLRRAAHVLADEVVRPLGRHIEKAWEDLATIAMMKLTLPDGVVHLGHPIPPDPGGPLFPPELDTIDNPDLRAVLMHYNAFDIRVEEPSLGRVVDRFKAICSLGHPVTDDVLKAAAVDWVDFNERMRFILTLFRSRAADLRLTKSPFSPDQMASILGGQVPPGPL